MPEAAWRAGPPRHQRAGSRKRGVGQGRDCQTWSLVSDRTVPGGTAGAAALRSDVRWSKDRSCVGVEEGTTDSTGDSLRTAQAGAASPLTMCVMWRSEPASPLPSDERRRGWGD